MWQDCSRNRRPRRDFLKTAASTTLAVVAAPYIVPSTVLGADAPSGRIGVAVIGAGNQSTVDLPAFLKNDDVQVLAVCDVNTASHGYQSPAQFLGRKPAVEKVNQYYADRSGIGRYKGCDGYRDFRDVLVRKDVDAVVLIVPDHWHALMTVLACKARKDIYCEKPLSLTIHDGQQMVKAVREHKRVFQTGSQWRSCPVARRACELARNGRIGKLQRIVTYLPLNNFPGPGPGWKPMPVPEGFDYDRWLGPAPPAPYHQDRCLYRFRFILDYSGGQVTNTGAHANDLAQLGHGTEHTGPVELEDLGSEWPPKGNLFTTALRANFRARYADGVELHCVTQPPFGFGIRFEGSEGTIQFTTKGLKTQPESLKDSPIGPGEIHLPICNPARSPESADTRAANADHVRNFLDCVKSRQDPIEPVEIGHRTASLCHLGNIALLLKRKLRWDAVKERFIDDDAANAMLRRPYHGSWQLEG